MNAQDSTAVAVALAHIDAWSRHDWEKTTALLAPNVHALVTATHPDRGTSEFTGIDTYMARKTAGAQLVEPGSVRVISTIGDERNAIIVIAMRIGLGPGGTMVTWPDRASTRSMRTRRSKKERDAFFVLS